MDYEGSLNRTREIVARNLELFSKNSFEICILPGWAEIVENLLKELKKVLSGTSAKVQISEITEKFGTLRVYYCVERMSQMQRSLIGILMENAEKDSRTKCAVCGDHGKIDKSIGWISIRCERHKGQSEIFSDGYSLSVLAKHEDEMASLLKLQ